MVVNPNAMTVSVEPGKNPRHLYPHQVDAIAELNKLNRRSEFSTLLVLPTGAGKTMTAVTWLLNTAIDNTRKVLWIAHRHLLLEQAADSFKVNAFAEQLINRNSFKYRIVSGQHDRPIQIQYDDDILIASKDSIIRNLHSLDNWLKNEKELYFIIDEAHHATARSYRRIIEHVKKKVPHVRMLGLTATPFRTSEQEQGLLGQIFTDDIVYKIDLDTLIKRGILSTPVCESYDTDILLGNALSLGAIKSIEQLDIIPEDIAKIIADNGERNRFIVDIYFNNYEKYGQTLIFALNRIHAFALKSLFDEYGEKLGIESGVIVSGVSAEFIGIDISNEENSRQIKAYRNGKIQVLINVNILTEGTDLPKTQTVFLTRPTISTVLMTQMIGRALRGEHAGGTKEAYIVSFIDNWNDKVAWVNPESILSEEESSFTDKEYEKRKQDIRIISINKLEEFARIVNETVDTTRLESLDFILRVPLGMYVFTFIDENNMEHNHQILVYNNSEQKYLDLIASLPELFKEFGVDDEVIPEDILREMMEQCEFAYFDADMIPPYNRKDIEYLLKFFARKESAPLFIPFNEIDRQKVNLTNIAKKIVEKDMRRSEQNDYINSLWDDEKSLLRVYFGKKYFFKRQLDIEIDKLFGSDPIENNSKPQQPNTHINNPHCEYCKLVEVSENGLGEHERICVTSLSLQKIREVAPKYYKILKDSVDKGAKTANGEYRCAICSKESPHRGLFQIDHIIPMSKYGKSVAENLQLLCRPCNQRKSDRT